MSFGTLLGFAVLIALTAFLLREFGWRGVPAFALVGGAFLFCGAIPGAQRIGAYLSTLVGGEEASPYAAALLRVTGIGYLGALTQDVCLDLGEGTVGRAVGVIMRIEIFLVVLPFLTEVIGIGTELATV